MAYLEELKKTIEKMFENAESKEAIEQSTQLKSQLEGVEQEQKALLDKNAELIKSYKELVKHTSFKEQPSDVLENSKNAAATFDEQLDQFIQQMKQKEKGE